MKKASKIFAVLLCLVALCVPLVLPVSAGVYGGIEYFPETSDSNRISSDSLNIGYYLTSADRDIADTVTLSGLNYQSYIKSYGSVFWGNTFMEVGVSEVWSDGYTSFSVDTYGAMCISYVSNNQRVYRSFTGFISYFGQGFDTWYLSCDNATLAFDCVDGYVNGITLKVGTAPYIDINQNDSVTICLFISPRTAMTDTFTYYGLAGAGRYLYLNQAYMEASPSSIPAEYVQEAYDRGYIDGSKANTTWYQYLFSVVEAPVNVLRTWLGFEVFGVNLASFVVSLFGIALIIIVIKKLVVK